MTGSYGNGSGGTGRLPIVDDVATDLPFTTPKSVLDRTIALAELLDLQSFRDVCASFVDLYKIGIKIFDGDGSKLVDIRVGSGDWCGYIFQNPTGRSKCTALVTRIKQFKYPALEGGEIIEQECFSGLKYVIMPITYGGDVLGRVIYGPFIPGDLKRPGEEVFHFGHDFEPKRLWSYGKPIRRAPDDVILKILANFKGVVDTITFIAMKALMTQQLHLESMTQSYNDLSATNRQLRASYEKLKELDKLKSNFLAMISHELRTPLTSVIGYSEMLMEGMAGELNEEQKQYVDTIKEKGESLLSLIGSLLDMSKIEANAMSLNLEEVSLGSLLERARTSVVPQAAKKEIEVTVEAVEPLPPFQVDADKIRQSVINLLSNAVKFTGKSGLIRVIARSWMGPRRYTGDQGRFGVADELFVRIDVMDSGIGIPANRLRDVFESFYQVDNTITREYGGTGLGLAIVKKFIEAHGGEVWVESEEEVGTTFTLLLPTKELG